MSVDYLLQIRCSLLTAAGRTFHVFFHSSMSLSFPILSLFLHYSLTHSLTQYTCFNKPAWKNPPAVSAVSPFLHITPSNIMFFVSLSIYALNGPKCVLIPLASWVDCHDVPGLPGCFISSIFQPHLPLLGLMGHKICLQTFQASDSKYLLYQIGMRKSQSVTWG